MASADVRPGVPGTILTFAWRTLLKMRHAPQQLFDAVAFPIMVTLVFTYLFGGALAGSTSRYLTYLLPGVVVLTVVMISMSTGVALNTDIATGVFDRFRSLPIWRPAMIIGALLADVVRYLTASVIALGLGMAMGFRPAGGLAGALLGLLLLQVFAFSLAWVWTTLGLIASKPQTVMSVSGIALFPLLFCSDIFVEPRTMPGWLATLVDVNPISHAVAAERALMYGTATTGQVGTALLTCALLVAVFGSATGYLFARQR